MNGVTGSKTGACGAAPETGQTQTDLLQECAEPWIIVKVVEHRVYRQLNRFAIMCRHKVLQGAKGLVILSDKRIPLRRNKVIWMPGSLHGLAFDRAQPHAGITLDASFTEGEPAAFLQSGALRIFLHLCHSFPLGESIVVALHGKVGPCQLVVCVGRIWNKREILADGGEQPEAVAVGAGDERRHAVYGWPKRVIGNGVIDFYLRLVPPALVRQQSGKPGMIDGAMRFRLNRPPQLAFAQSEVPGQTERNIAQHAVRLGEIGIELKSTFGQLLSFLLVIRWIEVTQRNVRSCHAGVGLREIGVQTYRLFVMSQGLIQRLGIANLCEFARLY